MAAIKAADFSLWRAGSGKPARETRVARGRILRRSGMSRYGFHDWAGKWRKTGKCRAQRNFAATCDRASCATSNVNWTNNHGSVLDGPHASSQRIREPCAFSEGVNLLATCCGLLMRLIHIVSGKIAPPMTCASSFSRYVPCPVSTNSYDKLCVSINNAGLSSCG